MGCTVNYSKNQAIDSFMIDDSNRLAYTVCKNLIGYLENDLGHKSTFNPIVLYGPSGYGKTHLLYAVYNAVNRESSLFVSAREWADDLIAGCVKKNMNDYQKKYYNRKLLIIDDLDDLIGKSVTQEALAVLIEKILSSGSYVLMASIRPLKDYPVLEEKLMDGVCSENGIIADITSPSAEFRKKIILSLANKLNINIEEMVVEYLAKKYPLTFSQLKGIMENLAFCISTNKQPITTDILNRVLLSYTIGDKEDEN